VRELVPLVVLDLSCGGLALFTFLLGIGVGIVLTCIPYGLQISKLRRRIERLEGVSAKVVA